MNAYIPIHVSIHTYDSSNCYKGRKTGAREDTTHGVGAAKEDN